ncbi:MAG TPA: DedA family protein [Chthoniobacteraceae bacterium]|jgi:membrane protein DedA with SNARE-associated domain|nr:DedA family protein [Chthoniobacteraceae bacterium]
MGHFANFCLAWVQQHVYLGTFLFMAMESSILPVPSELVIPPAAFIASKDGIVGIIAVGTAGSWFGSAVMYWLSRWLGRVFILNFGKYVMISEEKLERAEHWLHRYEAGGIFFARLLPVIRHLISIPAGIIRMSFGVFSAFTILGAGIWCTVLAIYGRQVLGKYAAVHPDWAQDPTHLRQAIQAQSHPLILGVLILCILYFIFIKLTTKKAA